MPGERSRSIWDRRRWRNGRRGREHGRANSRRRCRDRDREPKSNGCRACSWLCPWSDSTTGIERYVCGDISHGLVHIARRLHEGVRNELLPGGLGPRCMSQGTNGIPLTAKLSEGPYSGGSGTTFLRESRFLLEMIDLVPNHASTETWGARDPRRRVG